MLVVDKPILKVKDIEKFNKIIEDYSITKTMLTKPWEKSYIVTVREEYDYIDGWFEVKQLKDASEDSILQTEKYNLVVVSSLHLKSENGEKSKKDLLFEKLNEEILDFL